MAGGGDGAGLDSPHRLPHLFQKAAGKSRSDMTVPVDPIEGHGRVGVQAISKVMRLGGGLHLEMEVVGRTAIETGDPGPAPGWQCRTDGKRSGLRVHLTLPLDHFAMESAVEIRVLPGGMIMVAEGRGAVTVEGIQRTHWGAIGLVEAVNQ